MNGNWKAEYKQKLTTADNAALLVEDGNTVYLGVGSSTPNAIGEAIGLRGDELRGVTIITAFIVKPQRIVSGEYPLAFRNHTYFMGVHERVMKGKGLGDYTSVHLSQADIYFSKTAPPDIAVLQVSPPDENGYMSLGTSGICVGPFAVKAAKKVIVQVNKYEAFTYGTHNVIHVSDVDMIVEADEELMEYPVLQPSPETNAVSEFILDHIPDGACVQLGIGGVSNAVALGLKQKNDLGGYTELMTDTMMELMKCGAVNNTRKSFMPGKTVAAFTLGTRELYRFVDHNENLFFMPFTIVNDPVNIARNDNLISINTALEIDLLGQVNADNIAGDQYSATGGQVDFVRGAQMSKGGKSFIAMTATYTTKGSRRSRIVPQLPLGTAVTTPRSDVQYVATEYGCVNLKELSMRGRVHALIDLAHPEYRPELIEAARKMRLY